MDTLIGFLIGIFIGSLLGVFLMCLVIAVGGEDEELEWDSGQDGEKFGKT
jgi:high-affinity Fe2+/Pb2+ permease